MSETYTINLGLATIISPLHTRLGHLLPHVPRQIIGAGPVMTLRGSRSHAFVLPPTLMSAPMGMSPGMAARIRFGASKRQHLDRPALAN